MLMADTMKATFRKHVNTPLLRAVFLTCVVIGVLAAAYFAVQTDALSFHRYNQMAYRDDDGMVIVRRMSADEQCPLVVLLGPTALVCGGSVDIFGRETPLALSKTEDRLVQAAYFWQRVREAVWFPAQLASVLLVGLGMCIACALVILGCAAFAKKVATWIWSGGL